MFSGQNPPLITTLAVNCSECVRWVTRTAPGLLTVIWTSPPASRERQTPPESDSACPDIRVWDREGLTHAPKVSDSIPCQGTCEHQQSGGMNPPVQNSSLSLHLHRDLREAIKDLWAVWHIFCCCLKVHKLCVECEFWHPGDEQDLDLCVRGQICRWTSAGTMQ